MTNTENTKIETNPRTLEDIDDLFNDNNTPLNVPFDVLVAFQIAEGEPLEDGPSDAALALLDAWEQDTGDHSADWEAAVKRAQGTKPKAVQNDESAGQNEILQFGDFESDAAKAVLSSKITIMRAEKCKTPGNNWILGTGTVRELIENHFCEHPVTVEKDGKAFVYAQGTKSRKYTSSGKTIQFGHRVQNRIEKVTAFVVDVDGTDKAMRVANRIHELGLFGVVYTTHSHDAKKTENGDRFRVIVFFESPFEFPLDDMNARRDAVADYHSRYAGFCEELGLNEIDSTSMNLHQMMYTPRRVSEEAVFEHYIIAGSALRIEDMPLGDSSKYRKNGPSTGKLRDLSEKDHDGSAKLSDGFDQHDWYFDGGKHILMSDVLDMVSWDVRGASGDGWATIQCPNHAHHTEPEDDEAGFIEGDDGFGFHCFHSHCQHLNGFDFLGLIESAIIAGEASLPDGYETMSALLCDPTLYPEIDGEEFVFDPADYGVNEIIEISYLGSPKKVGAAFKTVSENEHSGDDHFAALYAAVERSGNKVAAAKKLQELMLTSHYNANDLKRLKKRGSEMLKAQRDADAAGKSEERRRKAEAEFDDRFSRDRDPYILLKDESPKTITDAASNAAWLPSGYNVRDGWICKLDFTEPGKSQPICKVFKVAGISYERGGTDIQVEIRFEHRSTERIGIVSRVFALGDAFRDSNALIAGLVGDGLMINPQGGTSKDGGPNAMADFIHLLRSIETDREAQIVPKPGWTEDRKTWISPAGEIVGGGQEYVLDPDMQVERPEKGGTFEGWKDNVDAVVPKVNGDIILSGVLSGFTGTYLDYINYPNTLIIAYEGESSKGKTTAQGYGVSVHTTPLPGGLMKKADATPTALENYIVESSGAVMALDDDGAAKMDAAEKQRLALQWSEGEGRGRGKRDGGRRRNNTWCTCATMSGEIGFVAGLEAAKLKDSSIEIRAGVVARAIAISMEGVPDLNEIDGGAAVIACYDSMVREPKNYGWAGPMFAQVLLDMGVEAAKAAHTKVIERLMASRKKRSDTERENFSSTEMRIVRAVAALITVGEIAAKHGIIGTVDVFGMMESLMIKSIDQRTGHLNVAEQTLESIRAAIVRGLNDGRVVNVFDVDGANPRGYIGYYGYPGADGKEDDTATAANILSKRTYYFPVDRLPEFGFHGDPVHLAKLFDAKGTLIKPADATKLTHQYMPHEGQTKQIRVSGVYVHGEEP